MMRARPTWMVILALPALLGFTWPGAMEWLCTRGMRQYRAQRYDDAASSFTRALAVDPGNATLAYNRGTALYRAGDFDGAEEALGQAAKVGESDLRRDATYNLGNARFRAEDFQGAVEAYRQVLREDPTDGDARYNLELAQRMLDQEQNQQSRQNQDEDQQQQQQDNEQQQQDQQQESDRQENDQQQEDQQQEQAGQEQQSEGDLQAGPQGGEESSGQQAEPTEDGELSAAQARRLLRALAGEDAQMQKIVRRSPRRSIPRPGEKDW